MGRLDDKVAIVTGGGQGLGAAMAEAFAAEGAKLALVGRDQEKLDAHGEILRGRGAEVLAVAGDVGERATAKHTVERTLQAFGRIDVLVNNAQTMAVNIPFAEHTDEQIDASIQSGLYGTIYMMQEAHAALCRDGGAVINLGSLNGVEGVAGSMAYAAAKEGIRGVSRVAAREWGRDGIRVNTICPGAITDTALRFFAENPGAQAQFEQRLALGHFADPLTDLGPLAVFLASPECFITGQTLACDGGQLML